MARLTRGPGRQPQFDWFSAYLNDRGLQPLWRAATFTCTAALAALPVVVIFSPVGPDRPVTVALCLASAGIAALGGALWLTRWPTRRQSLVFSLASSAAIATTCLSMSSPYAGLMGCTTFAVIGGFVAYFHTLNEVLINFAVAVACAAILASRLIAATGDIAQTTAAVITVAALNIGVPFGIESLVHSLRTDLRSSSRDPLTGLHNRRSFHHSAYELMMRHRTTGAHLVVTMIDLDNFKLLNDTRGHAAGDAALVDVSAALEDTCRRSAVIGRAGGEEFVIADVDTDPTALVNAERVRQAIVDTPSQVTASIGTAGACLDGSADRLSPELINELIRAADVAMYRAKRAGGNQVCPHDGCR